MTAASAQLELDDWEEVPRRCERAVPGVGHDNPRVMDLSARETTEDQQRIEAALEALIVQGARILHVGVGNSSLAQRFAARSGDILGLTVSETEKCHGDALRIAGYRIVLANKYSPDLGRITGEYDLIVDNNPASFGCCMAHFQDMLDHYSRLLVPGGMMLTDREGMYWCYGNGPMRLRYEHLQTIARLYPFSARRIDDHVFALCRTGPQ